VPAAVDSSWSEHVGKPLSQVPAPPGSEHANWADHFRAPLLTALEELGVEFRGISQTAMYTSGAYAGQVLLAMRERHRIDAILARSTGPSRSRPRRQAVQCCKASPVFVRQPSVVSQPPARRPGLSPDDATMNALALAGSGARGTRTTAPRRPGTTRTSRTARGVRPRPDDDHRVRRRDDG